MELNPFRVTSPESTGNGTLMERLTPESAGGHSASANLLLQGILTMRTIFTSFCRHLAVIWILWTVRFCLVYLGNPVIFFFYILFILDLAPDSWPVAKQMGTNVTWLNPITYIVVTLPLYIGWIVGSIGVSSKLGGSCCFRGNFDSEKFLAWYVSPGAIIASIPGFLNLSIWCTSGMEGNIMGFIFALPMLIAAVVNFVMWIRAIVSSFKDPDDVEDHEIRNEQV